MDNSVLYVSYFNWRDKPVYYLNNNNNNNNQQTFHFKQREACTPKMWVASKKRLEYNILRSFSLKLTLASYSR